MEKLCLKNEKWKDIPNYEGIYQASTFGRIRTCEGKTTFTIKHGERHWEQRILKPKGETYKTGYRVSLWKNGKPKDWLVARLCALTFLGEPLPDDTVNHIDGNRFNNNIDNLEWLTIGDNIRHAFKTGLMSKVCRGIRLYNDNYCEEFYSFSQASKFLKHNDRYVSNAILKNHNLRKKDTGELFYYDLTYPKHRVNLSMVEF